MRTPEPRKSARAKTIIIVVVIFIVVVVVVVVVAVVVVTIILVNIIIIIIIAIIIVMNYTIFTISSNIVICYIVDIVIDGVPAPVCSWSQLLLPETLWTCT